MNRRQFTHRLAALFATPSLPLGAGVAASAAPIAASTALPAAAISWANYLMAMHNTCTPEMLGAVLRLKPKAAGAVHSQMVANGVIKAQSPVINDLKRRLSLRLERPDLPNIRTAAADEYAALAKIWHDSWHRAHDEYVPQDLIEMRTFDEFLSRLPALKAVLRTAGPKGDPLGICTIHNDELSQIFIAETAEGTGVAQAFLADGEARIKALGHVQAWLGVVPENQRAIQFYRRAGWVETGREVIDLATARGTYPLETLIFRKDLIT